MMRSLLRRLTCLILLCMICGIPCATADEAPIPDPAPPAKSAVPQEEDDSDDPPPAAADSTLVPAPVTDEDPPPFDDDKPPAVDGAIPTLQEQISALAQEVELNRFMIQNRSAGVTSASANLPEVANGIHVIIVADTNDGDLGLGATGNIKKIDLLTNGSIIDNNGGKKAIRLSRAVLSGSQFSFDQFRSYLRSLSVEKNDALFVHFSCHGAAVKGTGQRFFQMPNGGGRFTFREQVWAELKAKQARLTVLATDSCSTFSPAPKTVGAPATAQQIPKGFWTLMMMQKGDIDVIGSGLGQDALYYTSTKGGFFTIAFDDAAYGYTGSNGKVSWKGFFNRVQAEMNQEYRNSGQAPRDLNFVGNYK